MITADYHTHSNFSPDSNASMEGLILRAIELGLTELVITDHHDYMSGGFANEPSADIDASIIEFTRLKEKYSKDINLPLGLELGLMPSQNHAIESFVAKYPFDFIIGSTHDPPTGAAYWHPSYFKDKSKREAYTGYLENALENVRLSDSFDVFGHLDFIFRYGKIFNAYPDNSLNYRDYADVIDEILKLLVSKGKGVEVNTSGYNKYGLNTTHPQPEILKRYRELGGEIVTVGSDSHGIKYIAKGFGQAEAVLKKAGFTAYALFRERKPVFKKF